MLGYSFSTAGIEILSLKGIENFTGKKGEKYGTLKRLIDDYHHRQTLVFVILDNEGRVDKVKEELIKSKSIYQPERFVTKEEYVFLWNRNIEFDNFSNKEIAVSLTKAGREKAQFSESEVEEAKNKFGLKWEGNSMSKLFESKIGVSLNKLKFLKLLTDHLENDENLKERPIVKLLKKILNLSATNHQPVNQRNWEENQKSEHLGEKTR